MSLSLAAWIERKRNPEIAVPDGQTTPDFGSPNPGCVIFHRRRD
jgi:hypothetical protein